MEITGGAFHTHVCNGDLEWDKINCYKTELEIKLQFTFELQERR